MGYFDDITSAYQTEINGVPTQKLQYKNFPKRPLDIGIKNKVRTSLIPPSTSSNNMPELPSTQKSESENTQINLSTDNSIDTNEIVKPKQSKKDLTYLDMYEMANPYKVPTEADLARERKKTKRQRLISALTDGFNALANIYFTSKGSPNILQPQSSISDVVMNRWKRINEQRKKEAYEDWRGRMEAIMKDREAEKQQERWQEKMQLSYLRELREQAAEEREASLANIKLKIENHKMNEAEAKAEIAKVEQQYAEKLQLSKINQANASAARSHAQAQNYRAIREKNEFHFLGKIYNNEADYEAAIYEKAKEYGIDESYLSSSEKTVVSPDEFNHDGTQKVTKTNTQTQKLKNRESLRSEVEREHAKRIKASQAFEKGIISNGGKGGTVIIENDDDITL